MLFVLMVQNGPVRLEGVADMPGNRDDPDALSRLGCWETFPMASFRPPGVGV